MVYVPMDTRPVCKDYTIATMHAAGWNIVVPPDELLSSLERDGQPDKLLEWLRKIKIMIFILTSFMSQ